MICIFITLDYGFPGKYSNDLAAETVGARKNQTTATADATAAADSNAITADDGVSLIEQLSGIGGEVDGALGEAEKPDVRFRALRSTRK